jgi:hypothetical protein
MIMSINQETQSRRITTEELERLIESCKGSPALLEKSQVFKLEDKLNETGVGRRAALLVATKSFDEFKDAILNDRELAVAMADVERCARDAVECLRIAYRIAMQSQVWILTALSERDDYEEILTEVGSLPEGDDADDSLH